MTTLLYTGSGAPVDGQPKALPPSMHARATHPQHYLAEPGLVDAVNTALLLRQPLLVTGEPGTGKTQLAASVSWELGLGERPLRFDAKSHCKSRDLLYTVDTLGWFQLAHSGMNAKATALDFITYNAFGLALLFANDRDKVAHLLPPTVQHPGLRRHSVVLIDEIDKAPRDVPNDLLSEIEEMSFRIPELGGAEVAADKDYAPVLVFTSNSERDLPEAFLRRCVYYDIPFPAPERLADIARARLAEALGDDAFLGDALDLFGRLRHSDAGLRKKPATAELLNWIAAVRRLAPQDANPLRAKPATARTAISALIKTEDDQKRSEPVLQAWIRARS